jgi:hypothetical protein
MVFVRLLPLGETAEGRDTVLYCFSQVVLPWLDDTIDGISGSGADEHHMP